MTSKRKNANEPAEAETVQPRQQMADDGGTESAETFANIEPDAESFANINPANE